MTTNESDFRQFTGAFDASMNPDDAFAQRLALELRARQPGANLQSPITVSAKSASGNLVLPKSRPSLLTIAAAVLLVAVLAGSSLWLVDNRLTGDQYASVPEIAQLGSTTGSPAPERTLVPEHLIEGQGISLTGVLGDLLIYRIDGRPGEAYVEPKVIAADADTGETLWETSGVGFSFVARHENMVIGLASGPMSEIDRTESFTDPFPRSLVALNAYNGEELWRIELSNPDTAPVAPGWSQPVVVEGLIVVAVPGELRAYNLDSGELTWSHELPLTPIGPESPYSQPAVVAFGGQVIVAGTDGYLRFFDAASGRLQDEMPIEGFTGSGVTPSIQLLLWDGGVVVAWPTFQGSPSVHAYSLELPSKEVLWSIEVPMQGEVNVSGDGSVSVLTSEWQQGNWLMRLFGVQGSFLNSLAWYDGETGELILETGKFKHSGHVATSAHASDDYACMVNTSVFCFDRNGSRVVIELDGIWHGRVYGDTYYLETETGIWKVDLP